MHRFQSKSTINRFRVAALLLCLKVLLIPCVIGLLVHALLTDNLPLTFGALGMGGFAIFVGIVQCVVALRTRCPLCMTPVLSGIRCSKHRNARSFMGSYRLRVALAVLFRGSFHCPFCHEPSVMETRNRLRRQGGRVRRR